MINLTEIQKEVANGNVSVRKSKTGKLSIYNYTKECQHSDTWNDTTKMCRGLILDENNNVIARPFEKFFNDFELEHLGLTIPNEPFDVYVKLDGSLGILYKDDGEYSIATRGSFESDQAIEGTKILKEKYSHIKFDDNITYIFEIIYPENRIVVDYNGMRDLILLAMIDTKTGKDVPLEDIGIPIVEKYDGIKDFNTLKNLNESNKEGFVVKFQSGFRMKLKFENYFMLHRIVTNLNKKTILEVLESNKDFDSFLIDIPEEYKQWAIDTKCQIEDMYGMIEYTNNEYMDDYEIFDLVNRKEQAITIQKYFPKEHVSIAFKKLDNKDYSSVIWDMVREKIKNVD